MDGSVPLQFWYVSSLVVSALIVAATGALVYTRTETHHRTEFVAYVAVQWCWVVAAIAKLLVRVPAAKYALSLLTDLFAVVAIVTVGYFATVYTNRSTSPRRPQNALAVGWAAVAVVGILTQPVFGLQYASVAYRQEPVAYLAIEPGPLYLLNSVVAAAILLVSFVYLARLFLSSNHRPTSSILLLVAAAVASLLPNAVTALETIPLLPGYDYTVFGIVPLTVILAYTVFFRGELDIAPMARTEIVDHIDDVLLGLDDAGRLIDYNAAAEPLLPPDVETPVGTELSRLLPGLAAEILLPAAGDADVSATYSTVVDGARTHYAVSVSPITERGTVAGYTVVARDVTAVEESKRELARQNDQLESFASTVAHDLRNPLQVADGATELLDRQLRAADDPAAAEAADHLDSVADAIDRMDARLDELRTLAEHAQSVTTTESVAFGPAVRAVWAAADTGEMALAVTADGHIEADRARLDSVLDQLVRHSGERGADRVEVALTGTGFTYEDDGRRIAECDREAVFDSDTTTAAASVGLGLEIVRTQVESQGWQVGVERTETGTAFVVTGGTTTAETEVGP
ncbi:PAS domain-containing protein [Haloarcula sp. S1CR25-12]|uniref:histidine kinase n=1 Tax=Haloarcula saliterrae TaxID=2950534 RepID=A0ABU2FI18_9EURY|nr:histidine kinase N-terminal 7TM domain-containing protein [Haloarcula sp. S1CR25-12]MDS0261366.1 PAS domain-containing protein [Haloarcula sp. S1CR25-12]